MTKSNYFLNMVLGTLLIGQGFVHGSVNRWKEAGYKSDFLKKNLELIEIPTESMGFIATLVGKKEIETAFKPDFGTFVEFSSTITYGAFVNGLKDLTQEFEKKFKLENKSYEELYQQHATENERLKTLLNINTDERLTKISELEKNNTELQAKLEQTKNLLDRIDQKRQQLDTDMSYARDEAVAFRSNAKSTEKISAMAQFYKKTTFFTISLALILIITNLATLYKLKMAR
jgi:hypothetical protein